MAHLSKTDCYDLVGVLCTAQYTGIMTSLLSMYKLTNVGSQFVLKGVLIFLSEFIKLRQNKTHKDKVEYVGDIYGYGLCSEGSGDMLSVIGISSQAC